MCLKIKNGAIFVSDAHYNKKNREFLLFLKKLNNEEIKTSQLFLLGDMFDFLAEYCSYFQQINKELIDLLNILSNKIEIIYLEGNHDYNLKNIFPNIEVISIDNQPLFVKYGKKSIPISHGDNFLDWKYGLYCKIIRNSILLRVLNFFDIQNFLSKKIEKGLEKKLICKKIVNFEKIVEKRLKNYNSEIVIEGHYHQGDKFIIDGKLYINIPSLTCQKEYVIEKDGKFLKEKI